MLSYVTCKNNQVLAECDINRCAWHFDAARKIFFTTQLQQQWQQNNRSNIYTQFTATGDESFPRLQKPTHARPFECRKPLFFLRAPHTKDIGCIAKRIWVELLGERGLYIHLLMTVTHRILLWEYIFKTILKPYSETLDLKPSVSRI